MKPTPIHKWNIPDVPSPFTVHIKRDDLTGSVLSGNKVGHWYFLATTIFFHFMQFSVEFKFYFIIILSFQCRKAEFLLGHALDKGCDSIITCGTVWSNHSRTIAIASRQLGLKCHLVLRSPHTVIHVPHTH